ncbi:hypothetical protein HCN44_003286 [Aphidius gifuensis]|uniref:PH domain-containing protein n=1 Tax=Aphidius gifuensis TaxID=684658 RepID=A0A835CK71_APHGI|nr:hypothetical protein HCN44_003286 [Aphidius gifuensis]
MEDLKTSQDVLYHGFLVKSPPTKRLFSRWRKRWFVLGHNAELPGQYFLKYYVEKGCKKLKGHIDLDQCEKIDAGLKYTNRKQKCQYMFSVITTERTYYLLAETEADMNRWVDIVCRLFYVDIHRIAKSFDKSTPGLKYLEVVFDESDSCSTTELSPAKLPPSPTSYTEIDALKTIALEKAKELAENERKHQS